MKAEMNFDNIGGGDSYAESLFVQVAASGVPSFTTVAKAKAIWITAIGNTGKLRVYTNVNPTTGEVDNSTLYYDESTGGAGAGWSVLSGNTFTVTDNSVTPSATIFSVASAQKIFYTY